MVKNARKFRRRWLVLRSRKSCFWRDDRSALLDVGRNEGMGVHLTFKAPRMSLMRFFNHKSPEILLYFDNIETFSWRRHSPLVVIGTYKWRCYDSGGGLDCLAWPPVHQSIVRACLVLCARTCSIVTTRNVKHLNTHFKRKSFKFKSNSSVIVLSKCRWIKWHLI